MIILKVKMGEDNISYILSKREGSDYVVIDPVDYEEILKAAEKAKLGKLAVILNTHGHPDHTSGNFGLAKRTGAKILAHDPDRQQVPGNAGPLTDGDKLNFGGLTIRVLHTPGHTLGSVCFLVKPAGEAGMLFAGDTIFLSGCGNARFGGDPFKLYDTFDSIIFKLPRETILMPGHDYAVHNLEFALQLEPKNKAAKRKLAEAKKLNGQGKLPGSALAEESEYNPFFRLSSPDIVKYLSGEFKRPFEDERSVFLALRELRNKW